MINLNLLPPEEKQILRVEGLRRWLNFYIAAVSASLAVLIILLTAIWLSLSIQSKSLYSSLNVAKNSEQGRDIETQGRLTKELNEKMNEIEQFEKQRNSYSSVLTALARITPSNIELNALSIDKNNLMTLAGYAPSRNDVLDLEKALKESSYFENAQGPLSNLIRQSDIFFTFTASIKQPTLNK